MSQHLAVYTPGAQPVRIRVEDNQGAVLFNDIIQNPDNAPELFREVTRLYPFTRWSQAEAYTDGYSMPFTLYYSPSLNQNTIQYAHQRFNLYTELIRTVPRQCCIRLILRGEFFFGLGPPGPNFMQNAGIAPRPGPDYEEHSALANSPVVTDGPPDKLPQSTLAQMRALLSLEFI